MLKLFNTLSNKKEEFTPIKAGVVKMYNCGPTVYNHAHIGNLRAYVFTDVLRRVLEWNGYNVKQIMNITDVGHLTSDADEGEDKMVKGLRREKKPFTLEGMREVADIYTRAFVENLKSLNIKLPEKMPRASDHISEDIELIKKLEEKGFTYATNNGIYFDTSKFKGYGKLGNINLVGLKEGARVKKNPEKKNQKDFTLWKFSTNNLGWDSPWGKGFPGWHIECSAMSYKYLGQPFDIHTGGIDHIGTHHNNEIAQSESAFNEPMARFWMHNEHLNIANKKMSKSGENFLTLGYLNQLGVSPLDYRYYLLEAHYRTPIIFPIEKITKKERLSGAVALERLREEISILPEGGQVNQEYKTRFEDFINDDINTAGGLAVLWNLLNEKKIPEADRRKTALKFDEILGLNLSKQKEKESSLFEIPEEVSRLMRERESARTAKNWALSDELRDKIKKLGFLVTDKDNEQKIKKI